MKRRSLIVQLFGLFLPILALSQEMVKVNMLELYDKIPAPPADAKAAHSRLVCVVENTMQHCDLEKMTQEEKMKFAMQMSQQMAGMQNVQPESEEVQAAIEEVNQVNSRANEDFIGPDETAKRLTQIQSDWRRQHDEIRKWKDAEYEKVPQIAGGTGCGHDQVAESDARAQPQCHGQTTRR